MKVYPFISIPISYFPLTYLYSVDGVGERCRSSENPSMRGKSSLTHFPLLTYYENFFRKKFS